MPYHVPALAFLVIFSLASAQTSTPLQAPPSFTIAPDHGVSAGPIDDAWWKQFQDPKLDSLIAHATTANLDLRAAVARVAEARSNVDIARSDGLPHVNSTVTASRNRLRVVAAQSRTNYQFVPVTLNNFEGGFDLSWEIDVFGRVRNEVKAARFDARASTENSRDVLVTVLGDLGRYYADLRGTQLRLDIAQKNIAIEQDTVALTRIRTAAGLGTEFDVQRALAQLANVQAEVPTLEYTIRSDIHRISVLTGEPPEQLTGELLRPTPLPVSPPVIPVGMPSDLLERRPDIRSADAQLQAQMARIGQARADYFPRFSLTGSADRQATQVRFLTLGAANIYAIGPTISFPVFQGGRIRANVALQRSRAVELEDSYRNTILKALEETQNAIENYTREQDRHASLLSANESQKTALDLATVQYKAGLTDFLTVLDAERQLYLVQDQLAVSSTAVVVDTVAIYKAIAGGWISQSNPTLSTPP